jgi:Zn finger protein HypA/HybF involved in hydrogenase expression
MKCPKCGSENVNVQIVTNTKTVPRHGIVWWICIGCWWVPIKWFFFTLPALILAILPKNKKVVTKEKKMCVCQNCGKSWKA